LDRHWRKSRREETRFNKIRKAEERNTQEQKQRIGERGGTTRVLDVVYT